MASSRSSSASQQPTPEQTSYSTDDDDTSTDPRDGTKRARSDNDRDTRWVQNRAAANGDGNVYDDARDETMGARIDTSTDKSDDAGDAAMRAATP